MSTTTGKFTIGQRVTVNHSGAAGVWIVVKRNAKTYRVTNEVTGRSGRASEGLLRPIKQEVTAMVTKVAIKKVPVIRKTRIERAASDPALRTRKFAAPVKKVVIKRAPVKVTSKVSKNGANVPEAYAGPGKTTYTYVFSTGETVVRHFATVAEMKAYLVSGVPHLKGWTGEFTYDRATKEWTYVRFNSKGVRRPKSYDVIAFAGTFSNHMKGLK